MEIITTLLRQARYICVALLVAGLCWSVAYVVSADSGNVTIKGIEYVDLKTDGTTYTVSYADKYAVAGGDFERADLIQSKQTLRNSHLVIIETFRHVFPLRQLRVDGPVSRSTTVGDDVYLAGTYTSIDYQKRSNMSILDAPTLTILPYHIDTNAHVNFLIRHADELIIGGAFTKINDEPYNGLAFYDTVAYELIPWKPLLNGEVKAGIVRDAFLIIGGVFTMAEGQPRNHVAVYDLASRSLTSATADSKQIPTSFILSGTGVMVSTGTATHSVVILNSDLDAAVPVADVSITPQLTVTRGQSAPFIRGATPDPLSGELMVDAGKLGFKIPSLSDLLTFAIRALFAIAGLAALFYMLLGAFGWVTSGGDKDAVTAAREKIQSAVIGLVMMVVVLSLIWTLEQVIFKRRICFGLTCPITLPSLLETDEP